MKKNRIFLLFFILLCINGKVSTANQEPSIEQSMDSNCEQWITIFVHGIISIKPHLNFSNFLLWRRDNIADSVYAKTVEIIRKDPFFYKYHPMQPLGLLPIEFNCFEQGAATSIFARTFNAIGTYASSNMPVHTYYTYGWSGLLSQRMWQIEAELFYENLHKLVKEIKAAGKIPRIRMIGYSHGGTFALRLTLFDKGYFNIDELWLIGVPVLPESYNFIYHPFFKKIEHYYSYGDRVQRLDCFNNLYSDRIFHASRSRKLPEKLTQIQLKFRRSALRTSNGHCTLHKDGCTFFRSRMRNADPGHSELWSFGWSPGSYRTNFPLNPLPAATFLPFFSAFIAENCLHGQHVTFEVYPEYEFMLVKPSKGKPMEKPFIAQSFLNKIKEEALSCKPLLYTAEIFSERINKALEDAREWVKTELFSKPKKR